MKVATWNVNGLRAVERKGSLNEFISQHSPDVILLQEIKGKVEQFSNELIEKNEYEKIYHSAEKPGYSGVGVWVRSKYKLKESKTGMPGYKDIEGRVLRVDIDCKEKLSFVSVYVPNGGKSDKAYEDKLIFYKGLKKYLDDVRKSGRVCILGGDMNCAAEEIDLAQPERHSKNVCFTKEIRLEFKVFDETMVDVFRHFFPEKEGSYTYWDNFDFSLQKGIRPREINRGWRLDYFFTHKKDLRFIKGIQILDEVLGSDHCPVLIELLD